MTMIPCAVVMDANISWNEITRSVLRGCSVFRDDWFQNIYQHSRCEESRVSLHTEEVINIHSCCALFRVCSNRNQCRDEMIMTRFARKKHPSPDGWAIQSFWHWHYFTSRRKQFSFKKIENTPSIINGYVDLRRMFLLFRIFASLISFSNSP